jgi:hypothetical protein
VNGVQDIFHGIYSHLVWFQITFGDLKFQSMVSDLEFYFIQMFWFSIFWAWILALLQMSQSFGLDVVYHSRYFYVMCCECSDNDGYRHQHKNTQQSSIIF